MLQDLLRPVTTTTAVPQAAPSPSGPAIKPLPLVPGASDLRRWPVADLIELADVAYRAGDLTSAEELVRMIYARHDRHQGTTGLAEAPSALRASES